MNTIEWTRRAAKQLRRLDRPEQARIRDSVAGLADFPETRGTKALTNHQYSYRLRVGRYRVFFQFESAVRIVRIEEVKKRDDRTY